MTQAERDELRRTHVKGWKPCMVVELRVRVLEELLDAADELERSCATPATDAEPELGEAERRWVEDDTLIAGRDKP